MLSKYKQGDILVFTGDSTKFIVGHKYKIRGTGNIDYHIEDPNFGKNCLYFEDTIYGCYVDWADDNFKSIDDYREGKINEILK